MYLEPTHLIIAALVCFGLGAATATWIIAKLYKLAHMPTPKPAWKRR